MSIRYITIDAFARVHEVTNLIDIYDRKTDDPKLATACVIHLDNASYATAIDPDIPIYTVH
jgi:hypothetical protein